MTEKRMVFVLALGVAFLLAASGSQAADKAMFMKIKDKVAQAAKHLSEKGEEALPEFSDKSSDWSQEPYIFVYNLQGVILAHPNNPNLIGKNLIGVKDVKGKLFAQEFIEIAKTEGKGWSEYWWNKMGEKTPSRKISYIMRVPNRNMFLGAGIYESLSKADVIKLVGE